MRWYRSSGVRENAFLHKDYPQKKQGLATKLPVLTNKVKVDIFLADTY